VTDVSAAGRAATEPEPRRAAVTVRLFAAAAEAARADQVELAAEAASTAGALRRALVAAHGADLASVLPRCALVSGGVRLGDDAAIPPGSLVDVLPPFAGG